MPTLDLTGASLDLKVRAGDDPAFFLPTAVDMTAWTWSGQVRDSDDVAGTLVGQFDITVATSSTVIDGVTYPHGAVLKLAHTVTRTLPAAAFYDVQVIDSTGAVTTVLSGKVRVSQDVTT